MQGGKKERKRERRKGGVREDWDTWKLGQDVGLKIKSISPELAM